MESCALDALKFLSNQPKTGVLIMIIMTTEDVKKIIIEGITENGKKFRPSDWAERMSGALSTFGRDQRIKYSPKLQPMTLNGIKCISIDPSLKESHPEMYNYIMQWVNTNHLKVSELEQSADTSAKVSQAS
jgi:hypothetical protein